MPVPTMQVEITNKDVCLPIYTLCIAPIFGSGERVFCFICLRYEGKVNPSKENSIVLLGGIFSYNILFNPYFLLIGGLPLIGGGAVDLGRQLSDSQLEVAFLQHPFAIVVYEGEVVSLQRDGHGLGLTRL